MIDLKYLVIKTSDIYFDIYPSCRYLKFLKEYKRKFFPNFFCFCFNNKKYLFEEYIKDESLNLTIYEKIELISLALREFHRQVDLFDKIKRYNYFYEENLFYKMDKFFLNFQILLNRNSLKNKSFNIRHDTDEILYKYTKIRNRLFSQFNSSIINKSNSIGIIHGDMHLGNILINKKKEVKFIDFEYTSIFFKEYDVVSIFNNLNLLFPEKKARNLFDIFLKNYGSIGDTFYTLLTLRKIFLAIWKCKVYFLFNNLEDKIECEKRINSLKENTLC